MFREKAATPEELITHLEMVMEECITWRQNKKQAIIDESRRRSERVLRPDAGETLFVYLSICIEICI